MIHAVRPPRTTRAEVIAIGTASFLILITSPFRIVLSGKFCLAILRLMLSGGAKAVVWLLGTLCLDVRR